jgi:hypothetical protein
MLRGGLVKLLREMAVGPTKKRPTLSELAEWVVDELPRIAPDDPRTVQALRIAEVWRQHERR